jgi:hypothetical protein
VRRWLRGDVKPHPSQAPAVHNDTVKEWKSIVLDVEETLQNLDRTESPRFHIITATEQREVVAAEAVALQPLAQKVHKALKFAELA